MAWSNVYSIGPGIVMIIIWKQFLKIKSFEAAKDNNNDK